MSLLLLFFLEQKKMERKITYLLFYLQMKSFK